MGRYSDINRGPELQDAYEKYQLWLKRSRKDKKAAYKTVAKTTARANPERETGYILPFNAKSDIIYLETKILKASQTGAGAAPATAAQGLIASRIYANLPSPTTSAVIVARKFQFAKIIVSQRISTATTTSESRTTDTPYLRHRSDNASGSFGRSGTTDTYALALNNIKANSAYNTFTATVGNRIGFSPEGD